MHIRFLTRYLTRYGRKSRVPEVAACLCVHTHLPDSIWRDFGELDMSPDWLCDIQCNTSHSTPLNMDAACTWLMLTYTCYTEVIKYITST